MGFFAKFLKLPQKKLVFFSSNLGMILRLKAPKVWEVIGRFYNVLEQCSYISDFFEEKRKASILIQIPFFFNSTAMTTPIFQTLMQRFAESKISFSKTSFIDEVILKIAEELVWKTAHDELGSKCGFFGFFFSGFFFGVFFRQDW